MSAWTSSSGSSSTSSAASVEWHERIGDYDVALSNITSEKLAKGTLHPLEMTFESTACVFPIRLTRMAAGPVEELIYIEGPAHYEPATFVDDSWDIDLFGGPIHEVADDYPLTDLEHAARILAGETKVKTRSRLTKLRRVFQPEEMTEDLYFKKIDLDSWLNSQVPERVAEAATQYGRWRDPNGVVPLVNALSGEALAKLIPAKEDYQPWASPAARLLLWQGIGKWSYSPTEEDWATNPGCGPLRSCIWALGEIGVEYEIGQAAREKLLECAQHDNQLIRMEAFIALTKVQSEGLGPIFVDRLGDVLRSGELPVLYWLEYHAVLAELDIMSDWVVRFGTAEQKGAWTQTVSDLVVDVNESFIFDGGAERSVPVSLPWTEWTIWRAACTQDERLIPAMEELISRLSPEQAESVGPFLSRAKAACGSVEAMATVDRAILDAETRIIEAGQASGTGGITSLDNLYDYSSSRPQSLRVRILHRRGLACLLFPMPAQAADQAIRSALSDSTVGDWYALYLQAGIKNLQAEDKSRVMQIWSSGDEDHRLLAIDVLYVWGDEESLVDLYDQTESTNIKSEIAWALAALKIPEGVAIVEEQIRDSWNADWLAQDRTFIHPEPDRIGRYGDSGLPMEMQRNERALWHYFRPTSAILDPGRLAMLKRIAADPTIHSGMRFDLLGKTYGGTDWELPLFEQAARDILAVDSSTATVQKITTMMKTVGNSGFVVGSSSN